MALVLGINRTTDASCCLYSSNGELTFCRKERLTREKHAGGKLGDSKVYATFLGDRVKHLDAVVECFSSDQERSYAAAYQREVRESMPVSQRTVFLEISHHWAHAFSAITPSGFDHAAVLIVDNRGSWESLVQEEPEVALGAATGRLEVASAYALHQGHLRPMMKAWWRPGEPPTGLGMFYANLSTALLGRKRREGVMMGLAPFGERFRRRLPNLVVEGISVTIPPEWVEAIAECETRSFFRGGDWTFEQSAALAAAGQAAFEAALVTIALKVREQCGAENLIYAGGCALNCSANAALQEKAGYRNLFIPPACDDGGTAIGCALYGMTKVDIAAERFQWATDFLGPTLPPDKPSATTVVNSAGLRWVEPADPVQFLADKLIQGEIVGLIQGRSEAGARALGNRSLLADPRFEVMRYHMNAAVKGREWFRPLAPVVVLEKATQFFEDFEPSPFMQRRCLVRPAWRAQLAAVTHIDGSARVQTVKRDDNRFLYDLLRAFEQRSGFPILLNTSFNGKDEPIVESLDHAARSFDALGIHWLAIPPWVATSQNTPRSVLAQ
jgi:carbamoyltransferase